MRSLNWRSALTPQDLEWLIEGVITPEILERTRAMAGAHLATGAFGILDSKDPATFSAGDVSRPLRVTLNATNDLTLDVSVGKAISKSGELLYTTQPLLGLVLPTLAVSSVLVVSIKKTEVDYDIRPTDFPMVAVPGFRSRPGVDPGASMPSTDADLAEAERSMIEMIDAAAYSLLPEEERDDRVVLAVVTIQAGPVLSLDVARATYAFNRPWFSAVDVEHRSKVGRGLVTDDNPHGTTLSGLAAGEGVTAIQAWTPEGVVVARDGELARIPGFRCQEVIALGQLINDDLAGTISGIPAVGSVRTKLARLTNFPVRLLSAVRAQDGTDVSAFIVPFRPLIAIPPHEGASLVSDVTVTYSSVSAGQPPLGDIIAGSPPLVGANLTQLAFAQPVPARKELIISQGREFDEIEVAAASLIGYGTVPLAGRALLDSTGAVQLLPQAIVCQTRLDAAGSAAQPVTKTIFAPGRLRVSLTGAAAGATMAVQIQITGKDEAGATLSETVAFSGASWVDQAAPSCAESGAQFGNFGSQKVSANVWASITSWQVILRQNDGLNGAITIYVDPDSAESAVGDSLPLASFMWDGTKTCDLTDDRPVSLLALAPHSSPIIAEGHGLIRSLSPAPVAWYVEDFRAPRYMDAAQSTLDRGFDGCRGRAPDGVVTKATYVSRALGGKLDQVGAPGLSSLAVTVYALPGHSDPEVNPARCVQALQLRVYQGQAGGAWPGAALTVPSPYFGVPITPSSSPALPGGNLPVNRVQVLLTTNRLGNLLKGIAIAITSV